MSRMIVAIALVLSLSGLAVGQCWGSASPPAVAGADHGVAPGPDKTADAWALKTGHFFVVIYKQPGVHYIYKAADNVQVGAYRDGRYYPYDHKTKQWFPPGLPPWAPKVAVSDEPGTEVVQNFGVDTDKLADSPAYSVNGRKCTRKEAMEAVGDESIPEDGDKIQVVAVGDEAFLKRVADEWEQHKAFHLTAVLHCYGPDNWWVKANGLGSNIVLVADKTGKALHYQQGYNTGDFKLMGQVFDPAKAPDARSGDGLTALFNRVVAWIKENQLISLLVAAGLGYWYYKKNQAK